MNWNFIKTNWFFIAAGLLVLVALVRQNYKRLGIGYITTRTSQIVSIPVEDYHPTAFGLAKDQAPRQAAASAVDQATATAFLKRFSHVAVSERKKFGIPASVLLGTAFLNSGVGLSKAAQEANNFFATPCSADWEGESTTLSNRCVRKYETPWASWRDFSIFINTQLWYGKLRQTAGKDWRKWAKGLDNKGISPISNFGNKLEEVISYYRLYELDQSVVVTK